MINSAGAPTDQDAPDTSADEGDYTRDEAGCFFPGCTGNPRGRPLGSSRALRLARALAEAGVVAVVLTERPRMARRRGAPGASRHEPRRGRVSAPELDASDDGHGDLTRDVLAVAPGSLGSRPTPAGAREDRHHG